MKKLTYILLFLLLAGTVLAGSLKPYAFPFIGRWQPSEDPVLIDDYGFQDIQNLRKDGKRLKGVSGHTKINTSVWDATYAYSKNGFHFRKAQPSESHTIILATDASGANGTLYQNTTAIPSQGNFSGTILHTDAASADIGRFGIAPKGNMAYCNGEETLIWGGDELVVTSFVVSTAAITTTITAPKDFSDEVSNTRQTGDEVAQITDGIDSNTVLMLHCDGADASTTFTDSSTTPHTPAAQGDAQIDTDYKKFGSGAGLFDGTGDYVSIPDHADFFMGTDPVTIDFWFRPTSFTGAMSNVRLFRQYTDVDNYIICYWEYGGGFKFTVRTGASTKIDATSDTYSLQEDTWYHFALIRNWGGSANVWAFCINGTEIGTFTDADAWHDEGAAFEIGKSEAAGYYDGHIDEFRVSKGVARWQSNFDVPVRPYKNIGRYWLVGATRPLQGVKYYVNQANLITSTMTGKEWNGASWEDLTITDSTSSGGISLAQTGTVTWATTEDTAKASVYQGMSLFWYQFAIDAGEAEIYYCTVDAPIQTIKNIWSIDPATCNSFNVYHSSVWKDYSLEINSPSSAEYSTSSFSAKLGGQTNAEYVYGSFLSQLSAINIKMTSAVNTNAATVTVYYHDGSGWVSVGTVVDTTSEGGVALAKSGYLSWNPPIREEEFTQNLFGLGTGANFDDMDEFYYKIVWSANLSASVEIDLVSGVPATYPVKGYKFPVMFQNRLWLFCEKARTKNIGIYSSYGNPDTFNGIDSGELYFGDNTEVIAAAPLYNLYRTLGVEQLVVAKAHSTYRVTGGGPQTWDNYRMSSNIGCIAPLSMATCDVAEVEESVKRQVVVWQTDNGVVMTDGATIDIISKDVACYWDANDSRCIPTARLDDSVGSYDPVLGRYTLLISSGAGQTTHNVELEYSLKDKEWTKIYRENGSGANPLQISFIAHDTNGKSYMFGATNEAYMYRLEDGKTWDGTAITQYVQTKDIMLDDEQPLFKHTNVEYLRLMFEDKATAATEDIDIIHYCDQAQTTHGTNDHFVPTDIDIADGPHELRECTLGPCLYHSFKFTAIISTVSDGMELTGMGLYYDPEKTLME